MKDNEKVEEKLLECKDKNSWVFTNRIEEVFAPVEESLKKELYYDSFPRFIRVKEFEKVFEKYKSNTKVMVISETTIFSYKNESFKEFVTDLDIEFMKSLSNDSFNWELLSSDNSNINFYYSANNVKILFK
jgi:hypothetical protein